MKTLRNTVIAIVLLIVIFSFWFASQIKKIKQQLTTNNPLTANNTPTSLEDLEKRLKTIEDCFE